MANHGRRPSIGSIALIFASWITSVPPQDVVTRVSAQTVPRTTGHTRPATAPPGPATSPRPIENLAVAWRITPAPGERPWLLSDASARWVIGVRASDDDAREIGVFDATNGTEVARFPGPRRPESIWESIDPWLADDDTLLFWRTAHELVAVTPREGRLLWSVPLLFVWKPPLERRGPNGIVLLMHPNDGLRALDPRTGRTLWTYAHQPALDTRVSWDERAVYYSCVDRRGNAIDRRAVALDRRTGRELWSHAIDTELYSWWQILPAGDRVSASCRESRVLDSTTGALLARTPVPPAFDDGTSPDAITFGSTLIRLARPVDYTALRPHVLQALDLRTSTVAWTTPSAPATLREGTDAIWVCSEHGTVRAIDPANGSVRFAYGVPMCRAPWPRVRDGMRLLRGAPHGDGLVVEVGDTLVGLLRGETSTPTERATIRGVVRINGRPRAGVRLFVDDRIVRSGRGGRFTVTLEARGSVGLFVPADEAKRVTRLPCSDDEPAWIPIDGTGRYRATVEAYAQTFECGTACHCD